MLGEDENVCVVLGESVCLVLGDWLCVLLGKPVSDLRGERMRMKDDNAQRAAASSVPAQHVTGAVGYARRSGQRSAWNGRTRNEDFTSSYMTRYQTRLGITNDINNELLLLVSVELRN